jgi:hypothetical protein
MGSNDSSLRDWRWFEQYFTWVRRYAWPQPTPTLTLTPTLARAGGLEPAPNPLFAPLTTINDDQRAGVLGLVGREYPHRRIAIIHVDADQELVLQRAERRAKTTGRMVPTATLQTALAEVSFLADAYISLGDANMSLGDAESSLGDATSSLGDATSSLGDAESSLGDAKSSLGDAKSSLGDAKSSLGR